MSKLYLVTGASGHLGCVLVKKLLEAGEEVRALVLPNDNKIPKGDIKVCFGDILDVDSLIPFFENHEKKDVIVIHAAGIVSITSRKNTKVYDTNVTGTKNIIMMCEMYNVVKLIYVSSVHAIPEKPRGEIISEIDVFSMESVQGLYAKTKALASKYVYEAGKRGLNVNIVHPSGICGPYDSGNGHMTTLVSDYFNGKLKAIVNGGYDFVDVRDVADGIISCSEKGREGECYILSNRYCTVKELIVILHEITGKKLIKVTIPDWLMKVVSPIAEIYYNIIKKTPLFTPYSIATLRSNANFSREKAETELDYRPRSLSESLRDTIAWLKAEDRLK